MNKQRAEKHLEKDSVELTIGSQKVHPLWIALVGSIDRTQPGNEWIAPVMSLVFQYAVETIQLERGWNGSTSLLGVLPICGARCVRFWKDAPLTVVHFSLNDCPSRTIPRPPTTRWRDTFPTQCAYSAVDERLYLSQDYDVWMYELRPQWCVKRNLKSLCFPYHAIQITNPVGLCLSTSTQPNRLWVCDVGCHHVARFKVYVEPDQWQTVDCQPLPPIGQNQLVFPVAVVYHESSQNLYVVDGERFRLSVFHKRDFVNHYSLPLSSIPTSIVAWQHLLFLSEPMEIKIHCFNTLTKEYSGALGHHRASSLVCVNNRLVSLDASSETIFIWPLL